MSHLFVANAALTNGEIVCMPADRVFGSSKSIECEFLKGKANFPVGAFALAASAEVEVVAVFCVKSATKKYKIFVRPISTDFSGNSGLSGNDKKSKIANSVKSYVAELEDVVKQYPEQWFNYYKFWKE
jgi:predicted LPLAT superfamily acyltransferase